MAQRILSAVFAGLLIATSFTLAGGAAGHPCAQSVDVEPWQTPRSFEDDHFSLLCDSS
jgi:hypothetical protein